MIIPELEKSTSHTAQTLRHTKHAARSAFPLHPGMMSKSSGTAGGRGVKLAWCDADFCGRIISGVTTIFALHRTLSVAQLDEEDRAVEVGERGLFNRALELIRAEFEERTWLAFWRTVVEGQAPKDVAADLSMSPGAVRVAKSRVLHRLRAELGDGIE